MSIAAIVRDNELVRDTAAERTTLELAGNDHLRSVPSGRLASFAKHAQERQVTPHKSARLWDTANVSELDRNESPSFETGWRWPLSYRSIEGLAIFVDALIIVFASVLADAGYHLATAALPTEITIHVGAAAVAAALLTCLLKERGLYKPTALINWGLQVRAVTISWVGVLIFLVGCAFALKIADTFSSVTIISFAVCGLGCLIAQRTLWRTILDNGMASGKLSGRTIVLISDSQPASNLQQVLWQRGFKVRRHFVVAGDCSHWNELVSEAISYARRSNIDEFFISADLNNWAKFCEITDRLRLLPLAVNLVLVGPTSELLQQPLSPIGNATIIELQRPPLSAFQLLTKRAIDIFLACTAAGMLSPLLALVAIAIKLDSPGPFIFRQTRHGLNGKPFQIWKFRTMTVLEDGESVKQAERFDKRVTRLGSWLRRTSIDELPQLINVLKGEMSIVGPRPHAAAHDNHFNEAIANYVFRQRMKPGITGYAQVNGSRGETPTVEDMQRRVALDIWYIDNWTFRLDLAIMIRTMIEVVHGRNAY